MSKLLVITAAFRHWRSGTEQLNQATRVLSVVGHHRVCRSHRNRQILAGVANVVQRQVGSCGGGTGDGRRWRNQRRSGARGKRRSVGSGGSGSLLLGQVLSHLQQLDQVLLDRLQERGQLGAHVLVGDTHVPVQKVEQLAFHEVDVLDREETVGVLSPVDVLGRAVVVELGGQDETAQEDAVAGARQALGVFGKLVLQLVQVDQGGHQGARVDVGVSDQFVDESHERRQWLTAEGSLTVFVVQARKHLQSGDDQLVDHVLRHWLVDEDVQSFHVDGGGHG